MNTKMYRFFLVVAFLSISICALTSLSIAEALTLTDTETQTVGTTDTVSTSRPSAIATLSQAAASGASQLIITDNDSLFMPGDTITVGTESSTVMSYSASDIPSTGTRTIYLQYPLSQTHATGTRVTYISKATHTISFTTTQDLPTDSEISIAFPGSANSTSTPTSASFAFNSLASTDILVNNASCDITVSSPTVTCTLTEDLPDSTTVTFLVGCLAQTNGICQTPKEIVINPTQTKTSGTADIWKVNLTTTDASSSATKTFKTYIATVSTVSVQAQVQSMIVMSTIGINPGSPVNTGNTKMCGISDTTTLSANSSATAISLGRLQKTPASVNTKIANISAQLISVGTNAASGYTLVATSSGHLTNTQTGYGIPDSLTPAVFKSGQAFFGIHPCGADVDSSLWTTGSTNTCSNVTEGSSGTLCKYAFPNATTPITLASDSTGPIGNEVATGSGQLSVLYAGGIDDSVPVGTYSAKITYTLSPNF